MEISVEIDGDRAVSDAAVAAIAEAEGVAPTELAPPLYESVDPEALDDLFSVPLGDVRVSFVHREYEVTVRSEGVDAVGLRIEETGFP